MKVLATSQGYVIVRAENFYFGQWEEADKINGVTVYKWKAVDADGNTIGYIMDENNASATGSEEPTCQIAEVDDELEEEIVSGGYIIMDGAPVINENWQEPPKSIEEQLAEQQELINIILGGEFND